MHNKLIFDYLMLWKIYKKTDIQNNWGNVWLSEKCKQYIWEVNWNVYLLQPRDDNRIPLEFKVIEAIITKKEFDKFTS